MSKALVEQFAAGPEKLSQAVRGLTPEDLLSRPPADAKIGKWSIHELVVHLADCDAVFADRMKRVISEDNPPLAAFDEDKWLAAMDYQGQSFADAMKLFEVTHSQLAHVLQKLPDGAFARFGTHSSGGKMTLAKILEKSTDHLEHHLKFVHLKRAWMGKEMW